MLNSKKYLSLDFGASTVDVVFWKDDKVVQIKSFETKDHSSINSIKKFLNELKISLQGIEKIFVTGGKSRNFEDKINDIQIEKINEIKAIGRGGYFLAKKFLEKEKEFLVVSMGTGTCIVKCKMKNASPKFWREKLKINHIGGTGIGGGTFLGLCKELIDETDILKLRKMFAKGDKRKVDLSVGEIIGSGIGIVSANNTASNLGKLARNVNSKKEDLAAGIVNLIGQAIGTNIVFAAKAEKVKKVVLIGKLIRFKEITDIILEVGKLYGVAMIVPKGGEYGTGVGALS
ncbi:hypothetical protein A2335_04990 [Candidatus Peregrinibacteria bacterium RIFOXYB2_FULL_32_7]|nr:MAG: hypothetical protein A2335_04990 [Candidatus Peregrinibacteria bacterium RIFOXYB2_FULL_32_7]